MQEASGDGNQASCGVSQTPSQRNVRSGIQSGSAAGLQFVAIRDVPFCIAPEQPVSVQTSARSSITVRRCAPKTLPATDLSLGRFSNQKLFLSDSKALMAPLCVKMKHLWPFIAIPLCTNKAGEMLHSKLQKPV